MEYRVLGSSGFSVPVLSFGTGTFGGNHPFFGKWGASDVAEATRLVDLCLEAGANMFDTADVYSFGQSEEILGEAVKGRRDKVLLATKATFGMSDDPNDVGSSRFHLIRSCEASLRRLQTDYVDVYTIHGFDARTAVEETLRALDTLVQSGKVRYIACSNFSGWHLMKSLAVSERYGWSRYVAHQAHYSLLRRELEWELMPLGLDQKVSTIVWGPLSQGRLSGKFRRNQPIPPGSRVAQGAGEGPAIARGVVLQRGGRARRHQRRDRQDRGAGVAQLAAPAPDRRQRPDRRPRRGPAARQPRRRRLESHRRAGRPPGRGHRSSTPSTPTGTSAASPTRNPTATAVYK